MVTWVRVSKRDENQPYLECVRFNRICERETNETLETKTAPGFLIWLTWWWMISRRNKHGEGNDWGVVWGQAHSKLFPFPSQTEGNWKTGVQSWPQEYSSVAVMLVKKPMAHIPIPYMGNNDGTLEIFGACTHKSVLSLSHTPLQTSHPNVGLARSNSQKAALLRFPAFWVTPTGRATPAYRILVAWISG